MRMANQYRWGTELARILHRWCNIHFIVSQGLQYLLLKQHKLMVMSKLGYLLGGVLLDVQIVAMRKPKLSFMVSQRGFSSPLWQCLVMRIRLRRGM